MKFLLTQKLLSARLHLALGILMLILQRSPILKLLAHAQHLQLGTPVARIIQAFALPAASLATPHALSGATNSSYSVDPDNPFTGKVGETVVIGFSINITPKSWSVDGDIPPGLRITDLRQRIEVENGLLVSSFGVISGDPTEAGSWDLTLTPWGNEDGTGEGPPTPLVITITIEPGETLPPTPPELSFERSDQTLAIIWQIDPNHNFTTVTSTDFKAWAPISATPQINGGQARIELPITSRENAFYRLALDEEE
ncbi:hypothetical protein [Pelagicoccus mobilis]|uniref:Uncharacterized protein n=1 Tax=Pelagicoccus mobilis TaxID=415221 RepID=A0A934S4J1_9BACT|nr:hypothetical protein [Pelagicoccus mobilis]MBK1878883.1 hypothetical protein [Pelagicoccus mobilis]